ncbi:MAG TPA: DNA-3-methyladenine glycosylase I [Polyangiaceae bacterium]|jgi:DNA-3-methyladenine glycosylase I
MLPEDGRRRCAWAEKTALERDYHDAEWGVPLRDDRALFELLCLEGMQAGLSWHTVLAKREGYRRAFHRFDARRLAGLGDGDLKPLLEDAGIIRHWGKITAIRDNARVVREAFPKRGALSERLWSFVEGAPRDNRQRRGRRLPASTDESLAMSKALRKTGLRFVGATTCYAFMQAAGMVNDHVLECFRHDGVA